ncbi:MAG: DUF502 domain-containing protein [Elusimicrobia bacterium]|nr:DUF502 domain-containing protein [Elusimicrobiota bacterium]
MSLARRIKRYLITGFLVLTPLSVSLLLLSWFVGWIDGLLSPLAQAMLGRGVPGIGLALALVLVLGTGWLSSNIIGQQVLDAVEDMVLHVPVLAWLYKTIKQLTDVLSPDSKSALRNVVLVEYPREGVYQLGFTTGQTRREGMDEPEELTSVYVPTNHFYIGDVLLVPSSRLRKTDMTLQQGIQFFLSAGASAPYSIRPPSSSKE